MGSRGITSRVLKLARDGALVSMKDQVLIRRPGTPSFDQATGMQTAHTSRQIYLGPARCYPATGPTPILVGEEIQTFQLTNISIPFDAIIPRRDDLVAVVFAWSDPQLQGVQFRILDVTVGGLQSSRVMQCQRQEHSSTWPPNEY